MLRDNRIPLIKSRFLQHVKDGDQAVIWHSLFGNPRIISAETLEFLNAFEIPRTLESVFNEYEINDEQQSGIKDLISCFFIIPQDFDERAFLAETSEKRKGSITTGSLVNYLGLIISEVCNFRCGYCIHFSNLQSSERLVSTKKHMSFEIAKNAVDGFLDILRKNGKKIASINFGGGEPLLNWPIIEQTLEYCKLKYGNEFKFKFSINTNATLINKTIARKLKNYSVSIASSLDGLQKSNDKVRQTANGKGTFYSIVKGFDILKKEKCLLNGFAITVNDQNFALVDEAIINWAANKDMQEVRIDIDVVGMVDISTKEIASKLMCLRNYAKAKNIVVTGFWERPVENLNESALNAPVGFCGGNRGNSLCINPSGQIYSCGYSAIPLGYLADIDSLFTANKPYNLFVQEYFPGSIPQCFGCSIEGQCAGGCKITREFASLNKTAKTDRMCVFYRHMTEKLLLESLSKLR